MNPARDKSLWDLQDELRRIDDRIREYHTAGMAAKEQLKIAKSRVEVQRAQKERQAFFAQQEAAEARAEAARNRAANIKFWQLVAANAARREREEATAEAARHARRARELEPMASALIVETIQSLIPTLLASLEAAKIQREQVVQEIHQVEERHRQSAADEWVAGEPLRAKRAAQRAAEYLANVEETRAARKIKKPRRSGADDVDYDHTPSM